MGVAIGFSIHTGWAAAVVLDDAPRVIVRARLALSDAGESSPDGHEPRFVFHVAAEKGYGPAEIERARDRTRELARLALAPLVAETHVTLAAFPKPKRALPGLAAILASHPLLHAAEAELYRGALVDACGALGVAVVDPAPVAPDLEKMSAPWGKDQKDAAALAWGALDIEKKIRRPNSFGAATGLGGKGDRR